MSSNGNTLGGQLAQQIRSARDRDRLTQVEAAKLLGVSLRTLQEWEAGRAFPQPRHRRKLDAFCQAAA